MEKELIEIIWHGRGGQGAKTAATMTAEAALEEGKYSQGFPEYGPERMGAPVRGFTRISQKPIRLHSSIYNPDIVVVLDQTLFKITNVLEGSDENLILLVNTEKNPSQIRKELGMQGGKVFTVDATNISIEELKRPLPNTPMMGALIKASHVLSLEVVLEDIKDKFSKKFNEKITQANLRCIERAYKEVQGE